tara:strand:- start:21551 stop:22216 length:666 start_codon:yes stop_codon:yes gene_type:complete
MKILVFDTETTGLPTKGASIYELNKWPYIIQLSYIYYDLSTNKITIKDNYIKISDSVKIEEESYNIHKISKDILNEKGISIKSALYEFNDYLKLCDLVIGHNISFDKRMIFAESLRNNVDQNFTIYKENKKICKPEYCTMRSTTQFCNIERLNKQNKPYLKVPKLTELYQKLFPDAIIPENLHNSLVDILITFKCYMKMILNQDITEHNDTVKDLFIKFNC